MQESVFTVHAQKPYPSQAFAHESSEVGGKGIKRKRDRKDRGQEADGKKGSPKHIGGTKTIPTAKVNKVGGGTPNFP